MNNEVEAFVGELRLLREANRALKARLEACTCGAAAPAPAPGDEQADLFERRPPNYCESCDD